MATIGKLVVLWLALVVVLCAVQGSDGQTICNIPIAGLRACKPSVTPPRPRPPTADCCRALSHADFRCLCSYKKSPLIPSLGISVPLAEQLPAKCRLSTAAKC
ncbi:Putative lipid-transfer protein DIR1 [Linum grandiflorum]